MHACAQVSALVSQDSSALDSSSRTDVRWWPWILAAALLIALALELYIAGLWLRNMVIKSGESARLLHMKRLAACSSLSRMPEICTHAVGRYRSAHE